MDRTTLTHKRVARGMARHALAALAALAMLVPAVSSCAQAPKAQGEAASAPVETPKSERRPVKLFFIGDMMQHDAQIAAAYDSTSKSYDYEPYFRHLAPAWTDADLAVCNFEVTLGGKPYKGYPCFSAPDEYFAEMLRVGFDVFLTANNHCLDKGQAGLERTIAKMRDAMLANDKIRQLGTYEDSLDRVFRYPVVIERGGWNIGLLNYTYGTNGLTAKGGNIVNYIDTATIRTDIAKAREMGADYVIACMHWGIEYKYEPNAEQRKLARWLVSNGVDHVIGGHPHVVQPAEIIETPDGRKHYVIYSLGNVVSNMKLAGTDGGIMTGLTIGNENYNDDAASAWYSSFHVARPIHSKLKNYIAYPAGTEASLLPNDDEKRRLAEFTKLVRDVMAKGDSIAERTAQHWKGK